MDYKKPSVDLRNYYSVFLQLSLVVVLGVFIGASKVQFVSEESEVDLTQEQEVVEMEEVTQTKQEEKPPPPPRPQVPVEVPNDEIIEDQDINIDAEINMDEPLPEPEEPEGEEEEDFFVAVEQMPKMIGGQEWLYENINYPEMARKAGIEGRVIVQFVVGKDGQAKNINVLRGIGGGCDKAAIDVIKKAEFEPGRQRGNAVPVQMAQNITFELQN
ncbi:energy transducer TonB [Fodinibius sp.]|uniref:energy transducer TonB n=1 Tax=Fodinibius sp. TaxID=1872440 RepID=UPI002ACE1BB1|nr:energy transducer TonB [Fodinibius sp.]MDZ7659619.1 energy transducer TonB [Fodinibius sp.]